jgi:hypothetical protein
MVWRPNMKYSQSRLETMSISSHFPDPCAVRGCYEVKKRDHSLRGVEQYLAEQL